MKRFFVLAALLFAVSACSTSESADPGKTSAEPAAERLSKSAPITETATPNKPATPEAADVETQDLDSLRAELDALNKDLATIRTDLSTTEPQRSATASVMPDTQISTPRALPTDGVIGIPDSKPELAAKSTAQGTVRGIRVGAHPDKTRLVVEIEGSPSSKPVANVSGKTLVLQMDNTQWPNAEQELASLEGSLGVSKVTRSMDNTTVTIILNDASTLQNQMVLPPAETGGARRFVVDLAPGL